MRDWRSDEELEIYDILIELMICLASGKMNRQMYPKIMGRMRDLKIKLENKSMGCRTGLHASECLCEQGVFKAVSTIKNNSMREKHGQKTV